METRKVISYAPVFPGFYNTIFDINEQEETDRYNNHHKTNYECYDLDFDYEVYFEEVGEYSTSILLGYIQEELKLSDKEFYMEFKEIYSPKEYNFKNDRINVEYTVSPVALNNIKQKLIEFKDDFKIYIEDKFTNRDGFVSFFSNDVNKWIYIYLNMDDKNLNIALSESLNFLLVKIWDYDDDALLDDLKGNVGINISKKYKKRKN